ncbi:ANTAR domain-containing protein [Rhodococcus sp. TAF43]|uniref:GAF and ANTAR domain-containing protein n=1 Tax=unclassified Rhodococcus (in: high G+C Gram-positive bacteria) TaxID=192944 RepID=UPI000E0C64EE|nr:GAF and ANTAR domain-containing protein [Rhodococcus sp. AG1013]RDI19486.1 GAF domain-containing protein [Rhodococcus sp. AG1013]
MGDEQTIPDEQSELKGSVDELTSSLRELSGMLDDVDELEHVLQCLVESAVRIVPDADMGGVTILRDGKAETAAATDLRVREIDSTQYDLDDGPCLRSAREQATQNVDRQEIRRRWPGLADVAESNGVGSFIASPLTLDDRVSGSFNLYSSDDDGFRTLDESLLEAFTTAAMVALRQTQRYDGARRSVRALEAALKSRASIDHAIGVLMALHGIDPEAAFDLMVKTSQQSNTKLRDVAQQLLAKIDRS